MIRNGMMTKRMWALTLLKLNYLKLIELMRSIAIAKEVLIYRIKMTS